MNLGASFLAGLHCRVCGVVGAEWLAARPRRKAGGYKHALQAPKKGPQGKRGQREGAGGNTLPPERARIVLLEVVLARR